MKRENLESKEFGLIIASRNFPFYAAPEADAVMDELEDRIKELESENERLKAELKQTEAQDQVVINGLRNALWKAKALSADLQADRIWEVNLLYLVSNPKDSLIYQIFKKWQWAGRKCRQKAKEYE